MLTKLDWNDSYGQHRKATETFIYILYVYMYSSNCTKYGSKHNKQIQKVIAPSSIFNKIVQLLQEKKEEIWPSSMTNAPTLTKKSKKQRKT